MRKHPGSRELCNYAAFYTVRCPDRVCPLTHLSLQRSSLPRAEPPAAHDYITATQRSTSIDGPGRHSFAELQVVRGFVTYLSCSRFVAWILRVSFVSTPSPSAVSLVVLPAGSDHFFPSRTVPCRVPVVRSTSHRAQRTSALRAFNVAGPLQFSATPLCAFQKPDLFDAKVNMDKKESTTDNPSKNSTSFECTASNTPVPSSSSSQRHSSHNHEDNEGHSSHDHEISRHISSPSESIVPGNLREIEQVLGSVHISDRETQLNELNAREAREFEELARSPGSCSLFDEFRPEIKIYYDDMPNGHILPDFHNYDMTQRVDRFKNVLPLDGNDYTEIKVTFYSRFKSSSFFVQHPLINKLHKHTKTRVVNAGRNGRQHKKKHLIVTMHTYVFMLELQAAIGTQNENFLEDNQRDFGTLHPMTITMGSYSWPLSYAPTEVPIIKKIERIVNGMAIRELSNCAICLEENVGNVLLEPCKHYYMCSSCWDKIVKVKVANYKCPICRAVIDDVTIYV